MASQSSRKKSGAISLNKGQAAIELVLISIFLLFAILATIESFQVFERETKKYLLTKEIKSQ